MESTNRITDDAMESAKYGLQMTQSGKWKTEGRPSARASHSISFKVGKECFTRFMARGVGVSLRDKALGFASCFISNSTPTPRAINRVKHS